MKKIILILFTLAVQLNIYAQYNNNNYAPVSTFSATETNTVTTNSPFFDKIRTERVTSDQNIEWINFSPGTSGYCEEFWCHPTDANTMFSGADMHAAFGSWDSGKTWKTLKDSDGSGLEMRRVIDISFSLQNPDYGIAFANDQTGSKTSGRLYETTDRGRSWSIVSTVGKCHSKLAIHPTNDKIWLLGAGDFWNVKSNHRSAARPNGIKQTRANYGYVWKTIDKGATWKKVATNLAPDNLDVGRIIFDRNNPNHVIMATSQGMFRSTDLGETWAVSATGLPNNLPRDLTSYYDSGTGEFILYAIEQTVYNPKGSSISSSGGIYKSTDGGVSWQNITGNLAINLQTITNFGIRDNYHRTIANWLGISKAVSKSTYTTFPTAALPTFNRIVVNPTNKNEIYLVHNKRHTFSFGPGDVWKTENGGTTWTAVSRAGQYWIKNTNQAYWQSRNNPTGANIEFSHLQRSMDKGRESLSAARMLAITIEGNVFTGIGQQLLRSDNGGTTWTQADNYELAPGSDTWVGRGNTNLPGRFMLLETGIPNRKLLCSGEHGLWQTVNSGNFQNPDAVAIEQIEGQNNDDGMHTASTVAVKPDDPNTIYLLASRQEHRGKLRRSTDGGKTWANIATIFEASNSEFQNLAHQNSLLIDPSTPDHMYFCATRKTVSEVGNSVDQSILTKGTYGVYRSTNGGIDWRASNSGLPANSSVRRLTMDPDNPKVIYASLNQFGNKDVGGLYKSTDGAVSWSKVSIPPVIKSVNNFFIDRNTGFMFISAGARAGALSDGGVWKSENKGATWTRIFEAPYVWQTEVSPVNSDLIVISVAAQVPSMITNFLNPGIYLSMDAGTTWTKINKGLAHAERTVDVKPDPVDESILWSAGWGSGWYKAIIKSQSLSVPVEQDVRTNQEINMYPNPVASGIFQLHHIDDNTEYTIWNFQGKMIQSGYASANQDIQVSNLSSGLYILRILSNNASVSKSFKFVVN
ncbi:T9SS type A sorting domain-containing protein [Aquimarina sp. ERC-38]|uniref:T9SS type A sorting domain-containing protein n=1 Tax=Aquimarina sp. ERC-38 TaxID=2949996 RepID=UPI002246CA17|nr:T9SS type A sorting domain-containing protein [Aquimarina sp. ERC-38]UZO82305.1 T9SS type A sorting domain-containing protein [Aquimarina sp. ERC-38]